MIIKTFKILTKLAFYLVALLTISIFSTYVWLATGEKSLPIVASYVSKQVNKLIPNTKFNIKELKAGINNKDYLPYINLKNLSITLSNNAPFVLSTAKIKLNPIGFLPFTKQTFVDLEVSLDKINFVYPAGKVNELTKNIPVNLIDDFLTKNRNKLKKLTFMLTNTSFTFSKSSNLITTNIEKASFIPIKQKGTLLFKVNIEGKVNQEKFALNLLLDTSSKKEVAISGVIKNITYRAIEDIGFGSNILENLDTQFDINFNASATKFNSLDTLDFNIHSKDGIINPNQSFSELIKIDSFLISGKCQNSCDIIEINKFSAISEDIELIAKGKFSKNILNLNVELDKINFGQILKLWPRNLAPKTYEWLKQYLKTAEVNNANISLNLNLASFAAGNPLEENDLHVNIPISNATLQYPEASPEISNISGVVDIFTNKIHINLASGNVLSSQLKNFAVDITGLAGNDILLTIKGEISGPVQDSIDLAYIHTEKENSNFKNLEGGSQSNIEISLPYREEGIKSEDINITVESKISDLKALLFDKYPISNGSLKAELKNKILYLTGTATYANDTPIKIEHTEFLQPVTPSDKASKTKIEFSIPKQYAKKEGYDIEDIIGGDKISAKLIIIKDQNQKTEMEINSNLKNNSLNFEKVGIKKDVGEPGSITFKLEPSNGGYTVKQYKLTIPELSSEGSIQMDKNFRVLSITSNKTLIKESLFGFIYKNNTKSDYLLLKGEEADLSKVKFSNLFQNSSTKRNKGFILETKLKRIKLKSNVILNSPRLDVKCNQSSCDSLTFSGNIGSGDKLEANLNYPAFNIDSTNAGKLISALGISSNVVNGSLKLIGNYSSKDVFNGTLSMSNYHLKHTPILAKLISLSSLTTASGIINLMQGKGIFFDELNCSFNYNSGIITLNKCVQKGHVLTILTNGTIDLNKNYMDISGTLIPANIINSIVDNIPLIGSPISGGKDSGIIGTNFSLKGSMDGDGPSAFVNPLSILTPGFLRNIFG